MKKIAVTTDLSEESWRAFEEAQKLAPRLDASIVILCFVQDPTYFAMFGPHGVSSATVDLAAIRKHAVANARERILSKLEKLGPPEKTEIRIVTGTDIAQGILDAARDEGADMIVMATHGRTGFSHLVLGSTAERVVRMSEIPVMTVRAPQIDK
ncbi:MAG: universal stress protein [Planctomycetes bacterium]|nr:universal stress protein [Planctomycetota bacterium]